MDKKEMNFWADQQGEGIVSFAVLVGILVLITFAVIVELANGVNAVLQAITGNICGLPGVSC